MAAIPFMWALEVLSKTPRFWVLLQLSIQQLDNDDKVILYSPSYFPYDRRLSLNLEPCRQRVSMV